VSTGDPHAVNLGHLQFDQFCIRCARAVSANMHELASREGRVRWRTAVFVGFERGGVAF
jgi:hypothetical protein